MKKPIAQRTQPKASRKSAAQDTETSILQSAQDVFSEKGFFGTTVAEIVDRAGVSRGTFYLYFKNREEVFSAILARVVGEMFMLSGSRQSGSLEERVEGANRAYLENFYRHRAFMRSVLQVATFDTDVADTLNDLRQRFIDRVRRHLERCQKDGLCKDTDPEISSFLLVVMVEFTAYSWLSFGWQPEGSTFDFDSVVKEASTLWSNAIYKSREQATS
jgi:AcrR family transcriptional regulator